MKFLNRILTFALLALATGVPVIHNAQPALAAESVTLTLDQYRQRNIKLRGPSDGAFFTLNLPSHWKIETPASFEFDLDVLIPGDTSSDSVDASAPVTVTAPSAGAGRCIAGTLSVVVNDQFLGNFPVLGAGSRLIKVPLSADALKPKNPAAANSLPVYIGFDGSDRCGVDQFPQVFVRPSSRLIVTRTEVDPSHDLRLLPKPLVQGSYEPDDALLVMPDRPSADEVEAALNVAAGFGRIADGFVLTPTTISAINEDMWRSHHIIMVGKPAGLPIIGLLDLKVGLKDNVFQIQDADDGVIQMATSPYNRGKVALVVSGNSDAGVVKAGKALSSGSVRPRKDNSVAIIAEAGVRRANNEPIPEVRSFGDLGYTTLRAQGAGYNNFVYEFNAPNSIALIGDAYVDVSYVHSALLDYERSSMNVLLNDVAIGSIRLADVSTRLNRTRVLVPEAALRPGVNRMVIQSVLSPRGVRNINTEGLWLSVQADSELRMRFTSKPAPSVAIRTNMANLPKPFTEESNLGGLAFVLPEGDPAALQTAVNIASSLGRQTSNVALDIRAAYSRADSMPDDELRSTRNLIVVGKAADLPLIQTLNPMLPAPYLEGGNIADERNAGVGYRVGNGEDVGYLQLIASPWNPQRAILLVLGSTDTGLSWAGDALTRKDRLGRLEGNLAFVNNEQVVSANVRMARAVQASAPAPESNPAQAIPGNDQGLATVATAVSSEVQPAPEAPAPSAAATRGLLFILLGLIGVAFVIIAGSTLLTQRRRRSRV